MKRPLINGQHWEDVDLKKIDIDTPSCWSTSFPPNAVGISRIKPKTHGLTTISKYYKRMTILKN